MLPDEIKGVLPIEEKCVQVAISYSQDHTMIFWDCTKGEAIRRVEDHNTFPIWVMQVSNDNKFLAVHGSECSITRPDGKHLFDLEDPESSSTVSCFQFFPDNTRVVSGNVSGEIKLYGLGQGGFDQKLITKVECDEDRKEVVDLLITPNGKYIIAATNQEAAFVFSTDNLTLVTKLPHITTVDKLAMTVDGSRILTASEDKNVRVWDVTKIGKENQTAHIDKHDDTVSTMTFLHHKDEIITTAYGSQEFKVWNVTTGKLLRSPPIPDKTSCHEVAVTSDDRRLIGAGGCRWFVLQLPEFKLLNTFQERFVLPSHFVLTPDDRRLVAGIGQPEFSIRIYDVSSGETLRKINLRSTALTMLPNGNFVNQYYQQMYDSTGKTKVMQMMNGHTGELVEEFRHGDRVLDYAISSDYSKLVCGCSDKDIDLWHLDGRSHFATLKGHSGRVLSVCFSPDNHVIASGADDGEVFLWSLDSNEIVHSLKGHKSDISSMVFSKDGRYLFTAAKDDLYIMVWLVANGNRVMTYNTYSVVRNMRISNVTNHIVVGLYDGRIAILEVNDFTSTTVKKRVMTKEYQNHESVKADTTRMGGDVVNQDRRSPGKTKKNKQESSQRKQKSKTCSLV